LPHRQTLFQPHRLLSATALSKQSSPRAPSVTPIATGPILSRTLSPLILLLLLEHLMALQDLLSLKQHLKDPSLPPLFIAHDDGACSDRGSFGWVIASLTQIFWEGSGRTYGRTPRSFRAESYGMLAALRFLHTYLQYWKVTITAPATKHLEYSMQLLNIQFFLFSSWKRNKIED
jgi:hypothetical protein